MKTIVKKAFGILVAIVMILSVMPTFVFAEDGIPVEKIYIGLTSGSIEAPNYGDTIVHPTFEILSTVPAQAKDCYKILSITGWKTGYGGSLQEGDTFDEDTYRLFVYISEKTSGAGDAYNLKRTEVYLLDNDEEKRLYGSASSKASTFNYINTYEVKAPSDIMPTIITSSFDGDYVINNSLYKKMEARGSKPISWSATGLPSGVSINSTTGEISGYPKQSGVFNVKVTATNLAGSVTKRLALHVKGITQKIQVKSIICDFEGSSAYAPVNGNALMDGVLKVVSAEPAEAMESISITSRWLDSNGSLLAPNNSFELGEYTFSLSIVALGSYEIAEDCTVFYRNTPVTKDSFVSGLLKGHVLFSTILPEKPTSLSVNGTYTFNGRHQVPNITGFDSKTMELVDTMQKNAGTHTATIKPWTTWADGTTDALTVDWTINPLDVYYGATLQIKTGVNKYTGYEQEVNIESVKIVIDGNTYDLVRGVDYYVGGTCTRWTNVGFAGTSPDDGFRICCFGNYFNYSPIQNWSIVKGDLPPLNFIVEAPKVPGGSGAVIGTTTDMIYLKSGMSYPLKCSDGRTVLTPGEYIVGKYGNANYNAVSKTVVIPEYDSASVSTLTFDGDSLIVANKSPLNAVCIVKITDTDGRLIDFKSFTVDSSTIVTKSFDEIGIATGGEATVKAMLWNSFTGMVPLSAAVTK